MPAAIWSTPWTSHKSYRRCPRSPAPGHNPSLPLRPFISPLVLFLLLLSVCFLFVFVCTVTMNPASQQTLATRPPCISRHGDTTVSVCLGDYHCMLAVFSTNRHCLPSRRLLQGGLVASVRHFVKSGSLTCVPIWSDKAMSGCGIAIAAFVSCSHTSSNHISEMPPPSASLSRHCHYH